MQLSMWLHVLINAALLFGLALLVRAYARRICKAVRLLRESRERMLRDGMICFRCGYNMRATPKRCSECGYEP